MNLTMSIAVAAGVGLVACLAGPPRALAQSPRFTLQAYGDVRYSHYDYGPDQKTGDHGSPPDSRAETDLAFFVTEMKYWFSPKLYLESEVEFEHGGTGVNLELEYEEFGEYETDIEKGGEVRVEEFHLTWRLDPAFSVRAGHFITAVGLANRSHKPTEFFTTVRSESEVSMLPTTWDESGVEVFGDVSRFKYRVQLINGLDSSGFGSKFWVVGGHQLKFETVRATDLAVAGRIDWEAAEGFTVGASAYYGNTTGNRPRPDMEGIDGHLTIADLHATFERGPLRGRALYQQGWLENADIISAKNSRLSTNLEAPRTPVAEGAYNWSAEAGFDVMWLVNRSASVRLYPFVRYERVDTMAETGAGTFADPRFDRTIATAGLNFFPHPDVVIKLDYAHRTFGSDQINNENTVGLDVGFATQLLEL